MEEITLGQVSAAVLFLVALGGGVVVLVKWIRGVIVKVMQEELEPMKKQLKDVDIENCKNYLVMYLASVDRGEKKDQIEEERFWEEYEHYQKIGGNSYIKTKVEQLKSSGKI